MRQRYTEVEMKQLLTEASKPGSEEARPFSFDEVRTAAEEAGIAPHRLEQAAEHFERRRGVRTGFALALAAMMIAGLAMILSPPQSFGGWRRGRLTLENEHRSVTYDVEILVPVDSAVDCAQPPTTRAARERYEPWRKITLDPGRRVELEAPRHPRSCPMIWVRTFAGEVEGSSAIFELPAAIEIERDGRLDQRGAGSPRMYPPPALFVRRGGVS
jgi:hypothetical protein